MTDPTRIELVTTCEHGRTQKHEWYTMRAEPECPRCGGKGFTGGHSGSDGIALDCACRLRICDGGSRREITDDDLHRLISHLRTTPYCSPACARNVLTRGTKD